MAQIENTIVEYNTKDLFEQGRRNICLDMFNKQEEEPQCFRNSSLEDIEQFMNKLAVLNPIVAFVKDGVKLFRVLQIIETRLGNVTVYNTQKLDKFGIRVYLSDEAEYIVCVNDKPIDFLMCTPNVSDIVYACYRSIFGGFTRTYRRVRQRFHKTIEKTLLE